MAVKLLVLLKYCTLCVLEIQILALMTKSWTEILIDSILNTSIKPHMSSTAYSEIHVFFLNA